ncbi:MAG TPA: GntR family transcriptional regulator [Stellaceae bacterium]
MAANGQPASTLAVRPIDTGSSFRTLAYARLREAIAAADIYGRPDEIRLDERQLAAALGVSRTPIREAMTLLEQEGFLRTLPRRGVFIVRKTKREIVEMIQVWAALESMAARLACAYAADAEIASLHTVMDEFAAEAGSAQEHLDEYSDANIAFHQAILRMGGSALIEQMTENLFVHVRAIRRATIAQRDRASRSVEDHMDIIRALERRDAATAERHVRDHTLGLADHVERYCDFLE